MAAKPGAKATVKQRKMTAVALPATSRRAFAGRALPYLALLFFTVLFYRNILFAPNVFVPFDLPTYHLPQAVLVSRSLAEGRLPLWDASTFCGRPLYANIQVQAFYPFRMATAIVGSGLSHVGMLRALEVEMILHVLLAGVFAMWLARRLGASEPAALFSGVSYGLGCYFASQAEHIGAMETASWLPLVWLSVVRLHDGPTFPRFAMLAGSLTLVLLAGFTPAAMVVWMSVGLLTVLYAGLMRKHWKPAVWVMAAGVTALLLASVQILPTMELSAHSIGSSRSVWRGTGGGLPLAALMTLVQPNYLGGFSWATFRPNYEITLSYVYCGMIPLLLAVAAVVFKPSRVKLAVVVLAVVGGVWMFGDSTPAGSALFLALPKFVQGVFYPAHWMAVFSLAVALLAGMGLELIPIRRKWAYAAVLVAAADLTYVGSNRPMNSTVDDPASVAVDSTIEADGTALAAMRRATSAAYPPDRIDGYKKEWVWEWEAPLTGVPTASGSDPLVLTRLARVREVLSGGLVWAFAPVERVDGTSLSLLGVKYLMAKEPVPDAELQQAGLVAGTSFPGRRLYVNPKSVPRFYFVRRVTPSSGEADSLNLIKRKDWDPRQEAIVEGIDGARELSGEGSARVVRYSDQSVEVQASVRKGESFLASSEAHYPGWEASIDGKPASIYYSDGAFRGVFVPEGEHRVVYRFRPSILLRSGLLSFCTLLGMCAAGAAGGNGVRMVKRTRWHMSLWLFRAARAVRP